MKRIEFIQGSTVDLDTFALTRDGSPVDLSQASVELTCRRRSSDRGDEALYRLKVGDGATLAIDGLSIQFTIRPKDTAWMRDGDDVLAVHSVQVVEPDGRVSKPDDWYGFTIIRPEINHTIIVPLSELSAGLVFPLPLALDISS